MKLIVNQKLVITRYTPPNIYISSNSICWFFHTDLLLSTSLRILKNNNSDQNNKLKRIYSNISEHITFSINNHSADGDSKNCQDTHNTKMIDRINENLCFFMS